MSINKTISVTPVSKAIASKLCRGTKALHLGQSLVTDSIQPIILHCVRQLALDTKRNDIKPNLLDMVRTVWLAALATDTECAKRFKAKGYNCKETKHGPKIDDSRMGAYTNMGGVFKVSPSVDTVIYRVAANIRATSIEEWVQTPDYKQAKREDSKPKAKARTIAKGSKKAVDTFFDSLFDAIAKDDNGKYRTQKQVEETIAVYAEAIAKVA